MKLFLSNPVEFLNIVEVDLGTQLGRGANAIIYKINIGGRNFAFKKYTNSKNINLEKLRAMILNPPATPSFLAQGKEYNLFSWPLSVAFSEANMSAGSTLGFIMPLIAGDQIKTLDYFYDFNLIPELSEEKNTALSIKVEILDKLCRLMTLLHQKNHFFVDIKPQNILVYEDKQIVSLIDCDGFSIFDQNNSRRFSSEMVSTDYISPEVTNSNFQPSKMELSQDLYALAVIIFQFLNNGIHPFQGILKSDVENATTNDQKAALGLYPYGQNSHPQIDPRPQSIHHAFLDETRGMFDRAFLTIDNRPTAEEWSNHFHDILINKKVVRCQNYPNDFTHMRFKEKECPACLVSQNGVGVSSGNPFPSVSLSSSSSPSSLKQITKFIAICFIIIILFFILNEIFGNKLKLSSNLQNINSNQISDFSTKSNADICIVALDLKRQTWDSNSYLDTWVREAKLRNLSVFDCKTLIENKKMAQSNNLPVIRTLSDAFKAADSGNYTLERDILYELANNQDAVAQGMLANLLLTNKGGEIDLNKAKYWATLSTERGNAGGQMVLGYIFENGLGVDKDISRAYELYRLAYAQPNHPIWIDERISYLKSKGIDIFSNPSQNNNSVPNNSASVITNSVPQGALIANNDFDIQDGWDIWGHDLGTFISNISEEECKSKCTENLSCNAFVYNYSLHKNGINSACMLKSSATIAYRFTGAKVGIPLVRNSNFLFLDDFSLKNDVAPKDFRYLKRFITSLDNCMLECHFDDECRGINYEKSTGYCHTIANDFSLIKSVGDITSKKN